MIASPIVMEPTYSTSYTLLERAKNQNDSQAWDQLIANYRKYIYVVIRSMNVNADDTDDILQLVLVELWKYLPNYKKSTPSSKFRHWLAKITRNQVISFIRRQKAHLNKIDNAQNQKQLDYVSSITPPEINHIITQEWQLFLTNSAMEKVQVHFTPTALKAFDLFRNGLSPKDIAQQLDVKPDSVYKYISRIKLKLIQEIEHLQQELDF